MNCKEPTTKKTDCTPMESSPANSLQELLNKYQEEWGWLIENRGDCHVQFCRENGFNELTLEVASSGLLPEGFPNRKHGHQRRLNNAALDEFAVWTISQSEQLNEQSNFESLLRVLRTNPITGIGLIATYDTAERIGASKKIYPKLVHLHGGVREGASYLLGVHLPGRIKSLKLNELPSIVVEFFDGRADMVESFLCIMKNQIKDLRDRGLLNNI